MQKGSKVRGFFKNEYLFAYSSRDTNALATVGKDLRSNAGLDGSINCRCALIVNIFDNNDLLLRSRFRQHISDPNHPIYDWSYDTIQCRFTFCNFFTIQDLPKLLIILIKSKTEYAFLATFIRRIAQNLTSKESVTIPYLLQTPK